MIKCVLKNKYIKKVNIYAKIIIINWKMQMFFKIKKRIITENPLEVWPVCALPTRGSKLITLPI